MDFNCFSHTSFNSDPLVLSVNQRRQTGPRYSHVMEQLIVILQDIREFKILDFKNVHIDCSNILWWNLLCTTVTFKQNEYFIVHLFFRYFSYLNELYKLTSSLPVLYLHNKLQLRHVCFLSFNNWWFYMPTLNSIRHLLFPMTIDLLGWNDY